MRCIEPDQIQKYIDEEITPGERVLIEEHIKHCNACAKKISNQLKLASHIKDALNLLLDETAPIPEFEIPSTRRKRHALTSRRLIYSLAAACILTLFIILFPNRETVAEDNEYFMQVVEREYDANRSITEQDLIIEIIDPEGNLTEYFLE